MINRDFLQRYLFEERPIRGEFIHLQHSFKTIMEQHQYPAPIRTLLGEALCIVSLLSATIKWEGRITLQFRGEGELTLLLAQCNKKLGIRGLAKWQGEVISQESLMASMAQGTLMIMLDSDETPTSYKGIVTCEGGSLADAIEGYFKNSEQLATRVWLKVNENEAAGCLLQVIPNEAAKTENQVMIDWDYIVAGTEKLDLDDLFALDNEQFLRKYYPEESIRIFDPVPIHFGCTCTRSRGKDAIMLLGKDEALQELKKHKTIIVTCDFCNKQYEFDPLDISNIFDQQNPSSHLH